MDPTGPILLGKDAISAAIRSGNVNIASNMQVEVMELSGESQEAQLKHAETLRKYEMQQRARGIIVPTSADDVKAKLRELRQPITLFGEGNADRRERLREVIARLELGQEELSKIQVNVLFYKCPYLVKFACSH
jgi:U4/U6 small nuclear ribonucleoprotein PRP4